ncbi:MAG: VOC family protein [Alphaproteobacteria bacterium]
MQLNPYLTFDGQCETAFRFYEQGLGGKIVAMMTYADTPMAEQTPPEMRGRIVHARLVVGDTVLMGSDAPSGRYEKMQGFSVALNIDEPERAERVFAALSAGGAVAMPIQETFWARRFGMLTDRFGTPWMINCEKPT